MMNRAKSLYRILYRWFLGRMISVLQRLPDLKWETKVFPHTIQMPITYNCNYNCVMCGVSTITHRTEMMVEEVEKVLSDKLFSRVRYVSISGGEPFIIKDLVKRIDVICKCLPRLKTINIITNGYFSERIKNQLPQIKRMCNSRGVSLQVELSIDGVQEIHDQMRGVKGAWNHVTETLDILKQGGDEFCDNLRVICTITKQNILWLDELDKWAQDKGVEIAYGLGTLIERLNNQEKLNSFSVLSDTTNRYLCREFLYKKFIEEGSKRYFGLFLYLVYGERYSPCPCKTKEWVLLQPDSSIAFCSPHGSELGRALDESAYDIFDKNKQYLDYLSQNYCSKCSHYIYSLNRQGLILFLKEKARIKNV